MLSNEEQRKLELERDNLKAENKRLGKAAEGFKESAEQSAAELQNLRVLHAKVKIESESHAMAGAELLKVLDEHGIEKPEITIGLEQGKVTVNRKKNLIIVPKGLTIPS